MADIGLDVVLRDDWDAEAPTEPVPDMKHPVEYVIYTHSLKVDKCYTEEECKIRVKELQTQHQAEGHPDILYNFLIGGDGRAYEGRGWTKQPDKSLIFPQYHGNRVDIAYLGNYEVFDNAPQAIQMACYRLVQCGVDFGFINPEHYPHDNGLCDETPHCPCKKSDMRLSFISMQFLRDHPDSDKEELDLKEPDYLPDFDYPDHVLDMMPDENLDFLPPYNRKTKKEVKWQQEEEEGH